MKQINVAEARKRFSDLLGRVAYGRETIEITRRGRPIARLVPVDAEQKTPFSVWEGWLPDEDPLFSFIEEIVQERGRHIPRVAGREQLRGGRSGGRSPP